MSLRIRQVAPQIGPGSGVGGVAYALEQEFAARGVATERFTLRECGGSWLPDALPGPLRYAAVAARVIWFSTVGTARLRRIIRDDPSDTVTITHNDALAGDIYVNHGLLTAAMRARGDFRRRMLRNPLHVVTHLRDRHRYGSTVIHRRIVNLCSTEDRLLRAEFPRLAVPTTVIGNGVDLQHFRPATAARRSAIRAELGVPADAFVVLFVGHEHGRKGLRPLLRALTELPADVRLLVVGGSRQERAASRAAAREASVLDRCMFQPAVDDPAPFFAAADVLAQPSAYESWGLVVTEALASGLPVVATPVGAAAELVRDGRTGALSTDQPSAIAAAITTVRNLPVAQTRSAARESAQSLGWGAVAADYLRLAREVAGERAR